MVGQGAGSDANRFTEKRNRNLIQTTEEIAAACEVVGEKEPARSPSTGEEE